MAPARGFSSFRPGLLALALAIAIFLWGIASGTSSAERGFDVPIELTGLADGLVVTDQSVDSINIRVMGSRAALRNVSPERYTYEIDVSGGKPGVAVYDVDVSRIDWPHGARPVSRSPSRVQVRFEKRGRKAVAVRADLEGQPAPGFRLIGVLKGSVVDVFVLFIHLILSNILQLFVNHRGFSDVSDNFSHEFGVVLVSVGKVFVGFP